QTGREVRQFVGNTDQVRHLAITPDGKTLVSSGFAAARVWELESGKDISPPKGIRCWSMACTPDGQLLAAGSVWDLATGKEVRAFKEPFHTFSLARDGKVLATWNDSS